MDLKEIKELIALMRKNELSEFKLEQENFKITLRRGVDFPAYTPQQAALPYPAALAPAPAALPSSAAAAASAPEKASREDLREIVAPMPGTFYSAATPESAPFTSPGREVSEDSVVCILEAMKVMNEIKAEMKGTIVDVVAENGKPVQYGQVLFRVR